MDLPILGNPGRTSVEDERDLSKSWPSGSTESGTSDFLKSNQSRSAETELHIFGVPAEINEMRKWTYPYLEVLAEQVWKMNEIFRSPGRAEVRNLIRTLAVKTERNCGSEAFKSPGRAEVQKLNFRSLAAKAGRVRKRNFTSYELAEQKCGTDFMSHHW